MNNDSRSITIIIRSKNESKWIGSCLKAIDDQDYEKKKIQVIVLDNLSTDGTQTIVKRYNTKLINYKTKKYYPGAALNTAVKFAKNEIVVFLSAHCIPTSKNWLKNLLNSFEENTAAVYGRQLPYSFSSSNDKRDLFNQFGLEKRIQKKDNFFHNANSAILKKLIKKYPFNEKVQHIEDRIWAKNILKKKYNIVYEPKASVWHYHGLNHSNNEKRSKGVGKILEELVIEKSKNSATVDFTHNLLTIISHNPLENDQNFLKELIKLEKLKGKSMLLGDVCIISHSKKFLNIVKKNLSFHPIFFKQKNLRTIKKIKNGLLKYEKQNNKIIDVVMIIDTGYIFKSIKEYKKLFEKFFLDNYDTVIPVKEDYNMYWKKQTNNELIRIDDANKRKSSGKKPLFMSLSSFATVIKPELIMEERRIGDFIGCVIVE